MCPVGRRSLVPKDDFEPVDPSSCSATLPPSGYCLVPHRQLEKAMPSLSAVSSKTLTGGSSRRRGAMPGWRLEGHHLEKVFPCTVWL